MKHHIKSRIITYIITIPWLIFPYLFPCLRPPCLGPGLRARGPGGRRPGAGAAAWRFNARGGRGAAGAGSVKPWHQGETQGVNQAEFIRSTSGETSGNQWRPVIFWVNPWFLCEFMRILLDGVCKQSVICGRITSLMSNDVLWGESSQGLTARNVPMPSLGCPELRLVLGWLGHLTIHGKPNSLGPQLGTNLYHACYCWLSSIISLPQSSQTITSHHQPTFTIKNCH